MKLKSEGGVVRPASRSCGKDLTLITAYRQQGIAPAATARHMICFASIRSFTGGSCGMSYERWGDLWNTEFLKMKLRVLQEKEFERLGSGRTHQINVRLIAATHRDLTELVRLGEFRSDLYYRLNVFPVLVPPLRERREDIRLLVLDFVEIFAKRMGKRIDQVPQTTMNALIAYSWPGNVRELQNLIERAVIRSDDGVLPNPLPRSEECVNTTIVSEGTFMDSQRALILQTLRAAGGMIVGPQGAAARLGLKRTTLVSKMKRLGIYRPRHQRVMGEFNERSELVM